MPESVNHWVPIPSSAGQLFHADPHKLDADWVILSACNTAAGGASDNAEALSGLARAFFYAGARSLLVSHWAVYSDTRRTTMKSG
jgi:CHAT domain-containing protein